MKCDICGKPRKLIDLSAGSQNGTLWCKSACRSCALLVRDAADALANNLNPKPD